MNPIDRIYIFALNVEVDESTAVDVYGSGGLTIVDSSFFTNRAEALAYAERLGTYYGVEVIELEPAS